MQSYPALSEQVGSQRMEEDSEATLVEIFESHSNETEGEIQEDEADLLQSSLFALTTHLAQIQFRLRQVVDAKPQDKEQLLKSLEEFAFEGVNSKNLLNQVIENNYLEKVKAQRIQQTQLTQQLKHQIRQLKHYKRGISKECALNHLLHNLRVKEELENQLKVQIVDLERFITYMKSKDTHKTQYKLYDFIQQTFAFLQMFAHINFNITNYFKSYKNNCNHWGDLRAKLELAVINVKNLIHSNKDKNTIAKAVRKDLANSIRDLMQHGLKSSNLVPFLSCFSDLPPVHSWDIILEYYTLRNEHYLNTAIEKLSRSFDLEIAGMKQDQKGHLLVAIEMIISTHVPYKRSSDSKFRAFVCAGLNSNRLVNWLHLIFHCGKIIETRYYPWSYVAKTRYHDGLMTLDTLTGCKFDLPVDLDVRKFRFCEVFN